MYRLLEVGEVIESGDEFLNSVTKKWQVRTVESCIPMNLGHHVRHRRPVRLQSPGWRYLDAGETVRAGDETLFIIDPIWRDARGASTFGRTVPEGHDKYFRRKLPASVGG